MFWCAPLSPEIRMQMGYPANVEMVWTGGVVSLAK